MNSAEPAPAGELAELAALLERRLEVIGDDDLRERDPDEQLRQLQAVGEAIFAMHDRLRGRIGPRLEHFLAGCSYDKALDFLRAELRS